MMWYLDSAHQNSWKTSSSNNSYDDINKKQIQPTLQKCHNDISSNQNTYYFMFDDFPLNQNEKWFDVRIQYIKTVGKHYFFQQLIFSHTQETNL